MIMPNVGKGIGREALSYTALKSVNFLESNWAKY